MRIPRFPYNSSIYYSTLPLSNRNLTGQLPKTGALTPTSSKNDLSPQAVDDFINSVFKPEPEPSEDDLDSKVINDFNSGDSSINDEPLIQNSQTTVSLDEVPENTPSSLRNNQSPLETRKLSAPRTPFIEPISSRLRSRDKKPDTNKEISFQPKATSLKEEIGKLRKKIRKEEEKTKQLEKKQQKIQLKTQELELELKSEQDRLQNSDQNRPPLPTTNSVENYDDFWKNNTRGPQNRMPARSSKRLKRPNPFIQNHERKINGPYETNTPKNTSISLLFNPVPNSDTESGDNLFVDGDFLFDAHE
jgi:hypothetical protein